MAKARNGKHYKTPSDAETVVELERETVRELRLMLRMYLWNTAFTGLGALAGIGALVLVALVWLLK